MKLKEYLRTLYGESDGGYIGISYRAGERMLTKWFPAAELTGKLHKRYRCKNGYLYLHQSTQEKADIKKPRL